MYKFSDSQISQCLIGPIISVEIVKKILADSDLYVNGLIDTEKFSSAFHKILDTELAHVIRENADWACGYLTADKLNSLINANR